MPWGLFADFENAGLAALATLCAYLGRQAGFDGFAVKRAYAATWEGLSERTWRRIRPLHIETIGAGSGRHYAERVLIADVLRYAEFPEIHSVALLGGDRALAPLIRRLRKDSSKRLILCSWPQATSETLRQAADFYLPLAASGRRRTRIISSEPRSISDSGIWQHERLADEQLAQARLVLQQLMEDSKHAQSLKDHGLSLSSIADHMKGFVPRLDTTRRRWLGQLLETACRDTQLCLAKSKTTGEHRLFKEGGVAEGFEVLRPICKNSQMTAASKS